MGKFDKFLIATDLDGTLLDSKKQVGAATEEKIGYFIENGGHFTFATGRLYQSFAVLRNKLKFNAPVIFANGAQIYDYQKEETIYSCYMDGRTAALCEDLLERYPSAALEIYRHNRCDTVRENDITRAHMINFLIDHETHASVADVSGGSWLKILFTAEHGVLTEMCEYARSVCDYNLFRFSTPNFLESFSAETDKGRGARRLAALLGVPDDKLVAAGDQENDMDLLRLAGISAAPANAAPAVKHSVHIVLPDNDHDAIAKLISYIDKMA